MLGTNGKWFYNYNVNKMGNHCCWTEWGMTPPTLMHSTMKAIMKYYYNPAKRDLQFLPLILELMMPLIMAALAAVIGHEMTHMVLMIRGNDLMLLVI